jgi:DNA-binding response OmpR family regulator
MHSEFISVEEDLSHFVSFAHQTIRSLSQPYGTARVVSGQRLSTMELALLRYFRQHVGRTLSRDELAEQVWKQRYFYGSRAIDQTVSNLRKKLRPGGERILGIYASGYRFESGSGDAQEGPKSFRARR